MIVDTSALLAILFQEDDAARFAQTLHDAEHPSISAATLAEAGLVVAHRKGESALADLESLVGRAGLQVVPLSERQAMLVWTAYIRYGKGRHPAALNFGDCFAYALAADSGEPLLFKGDDFSRTDLPAVL
jgi:ribonuclease VapC